MALLLVAVCAVVQFEQQPAARAQSGVLAFPGAEGFGAIASGGRGGSVYIVTTLEPFGEGSLGDALDPEKCEPRIIVFAVSGVIEVPGKHDLELTCGNVTIAGQTAPGGGITLAGRIDAYSADPSGNIIMRHIRFRPPPITDAEGAVDNLGTIYDALQMSNNSRVILDHISAAWGSDETLDMFENSSDVTIQWSTIEESNTEGQGEPHNTGLIVGPDSPRVSIHHIVCAHHRARCPAMSAGPGELVNSVIYDSKDGFVHHNPAEGEFHIVGNTFKAGPDSEEMTPMYFDDDGETGDTAYWLYQNDIQVPAVFEGIVDDISDTPLAEYAFEFGADDVISNPTDFRSESEGYVPITTQDPESAYESVLELAGAFPRDTVTRRTMEEIRDGSGGWGAHPPNDLMEGLSPGNSPPDGDEDGMADAWEEEHGLDPTNGDDHSTRMDSGYTAIEEYINELADALLPGEVGQGLPGIIDLPQGTAAGGDDDDDDRDNSSSGSGSNDDDSDDDSRSTPRGNNSSPNQAQLTSGDGGSSDTIAIIALVVAGLAAALSGASLYMTVRNKGGGSGPAPS